MIRYALVCERGHEFESWFQNSAAFESQSRRKLVTCPMCETTKVERAIMAPNISPSRRKSTGDTDVSKPAETTQVVTAQQRELMDKLRTLRDQVVKNADDVGERFPDEARKMHYGEIEHRAIYGEASLDEARDMIEEGIELAPLPVFPDDRN